MGSRRGGNILMALGVVLALLGGGMAFVMTQTAVGRAQQVEEAKGPVVLAQEDLLEGTIISDAKVQVVQWPVSAIPAGTITDKKDLIGKFAKVRVGARTPLNISQIAGKDVDKLPITAAPPGAPPVKAPTTVEPEYLLEKGQVLVAVDYPSATPLIKTGAVKAGSRVDIIVRVPGPTSDQIAPVFRNIQIRAIGSVSLDKQKEGAAGSLIFAVPPQDALVLKYLETMNPDLLLRAAGDDQNPGTDLVTQDYIYNKFRLQRPLTTTGAPAGRTP